MLCALVLQTISVHTYIDWRSHKYKYTYTTYLNISIKKVRIKSKKFLLSEKLMFISCTVAHYNCTP